jgi:translocation and assembly module TamA
LNGAVLPPNASLSAILRRRLFAAGLGLAALVNPAQAAVTVEITGVARELADAARANLELLRFANREIQARQAERLFQKGRGEIASALEPYGYYAATVDGEIVPDGGNFRAVYRVTPGEQVRIRTLRVEVRGPAGDLPELRAQLQAFQPAVGLPLDHGLYERSKTAIGSSLAAFGFFDAELERHRVEVTRAAGSADIDLSWNAGARYRFGRTAFPKVQFPEEFLQRYLPWDETEPYSTARLLALQQRLVDADYFSAVSVQPDIEKRADERVPIDVLLVPAKRTVYTANLFMSTDSGPGGGVGVQRRWLNDSGHKAGIELDYSQRLQSYTLSYRIPEPGIVNRNLNFAVGYRDEETDSSRSRLARASGSELLDDWHGYQRTLGLQYLTGQFQIADEQRSTSLLYAEALLARKRADDLMFPQHGVAVTYTLRTAAQGLLSSASFAQLRADAKWIEPLGHAARLLLRAGAGAMTVSNFDALPPELRFFAGGDRSIRGFDYQQIGETNATGGVIGGRYLAAASAEAEWYFRPAWGVATFVDAGDAFSGSFDANVGAGVGVRWRSPIGVVRVDFAYPVVTKLDKSLRVHVVIGPDL